jgi:hypothetical protein
MDNPSSQSRNDKTRTYTADSISSHYILITELNGIARDPRQALFICSGGADPSLIPVGSEDEARELIDRIKAIVARDREETTTG